MQEEAKKAYSQVLKLLKKHKEILVFDVQHLEEKSKLHILGLELKEKYGLNIDPKKVDRFDWLDFGEHKKIAWFGEKYNRKISWSVDGRQPEDELLFWLKFPTGPYIFGDDYPTELFQKFWLELKSFNPKYIDEANKCLYWNISNAKEMFNQFEDILKKYYDINKEDYKQRKIAKMKADLEKLEKQ